MNERFKFRIPMFTDKSNFQEFQYLELGEQEECTLCGYNGEPQQSTGLKDKNGKLIYELDYVRYANNKYKVEIDKFLGISLTNILNGDTIVMDDIVLFNCEVIGNEFESNTKI